MEYIVLILLGLVWAVALGGAVVRSCRAVRERRCTLTFQRHMTHHLTAPRRPGRHLMVPDDAESISRGARRRARQRARQRQLIQQLIAVGAVVAAAALVLGAPLTLVAGISAVLSAAAAVALHRLREHEAQRRRRQVLCTPGHGIGARRPDGGFSVTRRRGPDPTGAGSRPSFPRSHPSHAA